MTTTLPTFLLPRLGMAPTPLRRSALLGLAVSQASQTTRLSPSNTTTTPNNLILTRNRRPRPLSRRPIPRSATTSPILTHTQTRTFTATPQPARDHHFDTLKFIQRLQDEGFSEEQAISLMRVLSDVIEESIQNLTRTMVLREDALKTSYTQKVDFAALRTELLSLDTSENALTRTSHERLTNELAKLNNKLRDEIQRTQASVRLDLNLEKGRIREEANVQELKIKETETKIEQEVAGLRERVEGVKFSTLQWLVGVCTGTTALILGAWRLLM